MKMTRSISLLLVVFLLASLLVSCGGDNNATKETEAPKETTAETVPETENPIKVDPVDLGDFTLTIHYPAEAASTWHVLTSKSFTPEQTGDVVDNAIYDRNKQIEQDFHCHIVAEQGTYDNYWEETPILRTNIMSGTAGFDVLMGHLADGPNMSLEGLFLNLKKIDTLDLSQPWWPQQMVKEFTVDNQIYLLSDQIALGAVKGAKVHYINLKLFEDNQIKLPYEEVLSGNWTIDKLIALTKDFHISSGSDDKYEDIYGYVTQPEQNGFLVSCDTPVWERNDIDMLKINVGSEKLNQLVGKVYNWYYESNGSLITAGTNPDTGDEQNIWCAKSFGTGHALVGFGHVQTASTIFRDMEGLDYGMIPFPKWDEAQENYRTFTGGDLICVPYNIESSRLDAVGTLLSVMACENYKKVIPTYLNDALKGKYLNDEESKQVLDIVTGSLTISLSYAYDNWEAFGSLFSNLFGKGNPTKDVASYTARSMKKAEKRINKIVTFFEEHED